MVLSKYRNKYRILYVKTPSRSNKEYNNVLKIYQKNIREFHKYCVKMVTKRDKRFSIELIGLDGKVKGIYPRLSKNKVIDRIKRMPMGGLRCKYNLGLYSDYKPKTTVKGYGFKDKESAERTIKMLKEKKENYRKQVITTMYYRAKNHPYRNRNMEEAMRVYKKEMKRLGIK